MVSRRSNLPPARCLCASEGDAEQERVGSTAPAQPLRPPPRAPAFPRTAPAAPAGSPEERERLGRKTELQRDNVECKYQLNMHYHMPAPSRSVRRQHEPVRRCRSKELEAQKSTLLPRQPVPEPSLSEISSWGSAPALLPDEGSPLPAHRPAEAAAREPPPFQREGDEAVSPLPTRRWMRSSHEGCHPPARGCPLHPRGDAPQASTPLPGRRSA